MTKNQLKRIVILNIFLSLSILSFRLLANEVRMPDRLEKIIGIAVDKEGQTFYTEQSSLAYKKNSLEKIDTIYTSREGKLMAEIHSDFKKNRYLPDIRMKDHRDQYEYKIVYLPDEKKVEISQKENEKSNWDSKKINYKENMTNSVGLMLYIRDHAADLKTEKKKVFHYIIASRQDDYGMILEFLSEHEHLLRFNFKIENSILRSLAGGGDNQVQFDQKALQIIQFKGVSNLLDEKNHGVGITLNYKLSEVQVEKK